MLNGPLKNKNALVTGGGGPAMGSSHCEKLSRLGAHVIVFDKREEKAEIVSKKIIQNGGSSEFIVCDITNIEAVNDALERLKQRNPIDILVNHAGISGMSLPFEKITEDIFDNMLSVNLKSMFFITQKLIENMKKNNWGRIINIASDFTMYGSPLASHYTASKSAVLGLTKSWARELAPWKICVNAVAPTLLKSELTLASVGEAFLDSESKNAPMGSLPDAEDVSELVAFLASPSSKSITGQTISPNGGRTIVGI
ncbi:MAG: 3-oxoacyl-ACP reductase [Rhodospirillaceae bacterium]|nr:3-oxoacyl-ACP reductase [Rhodospirillaceae bacterium]|tara:strand:- start:205 stop:969 length:765 start_codon:yes stop_codon:yes gene_type:complete